MSKVLYIILLTLLYSAYYFPFSLRTFPLLNSKMFIAVIGLILFFYNRVNNRNLNIRIDIFGMIVWAVLLSLWSYFVITYNNTEDYVYVNYYMSMATWLGGAYMCMASTRFLYGKASVEIIFRYLSLMCVIHCFLAIIIDNIPIVKKIIDTIFYIDVHFFEENNRLYSVGVDTDTAGIRFSIVLLGLAYIMKKETTWIYIMSYVIIIVIGSVISRTTIVGVVISLLYIIISSLKTIGFYVKMHSIRLLIGITIFGSFIGGGISYLYKTMPEVQSYLRYGFEGFFNYFEYGKWETTSSNKVMGGLTQLPVESKTWIVGDGYFTDPFLSGAFYMGVDMGYVRFIYYFGLIGLLIFILYFMYCTFALCLRDNRHRLFFIMIFVIQLVVWIKIPTDIFCIFALLLLLSKEEMSKNQEIKNIDY